MKRSRSAWHGRQRCLPVTAWPEQEHPFPPILLTGMPGVGKSSVGAVLASLTHSPFIDLDRYYERRFGESPATTILRKGEELFRAREWRIFRPLLEVGNCVIACGGGTVGTRSRLKVASRKGLLITLTATNERIVERLGSAANHPLLEGGDLADRLQSLLERRWPVYARSKLVVDTTNMTPFEAASVILKQLTPIVDSCTKTASEPPHFPPYPTVFGRNREVGGILEGVIQLAKRSYPVWVSRLSLFAGLPELMGAAASGRRPFFVVDGALAGLHKEELHNLVTLTGGELIPVKSGEKAKSFAEAQRILTWLLERGATKGSAVVAIGGGAVLDFAGFCASVFMRSVPWIAVPTTLLAAVDAGIGGKTALNLPIAKNIVGTFHQPAGVLVPLEVVADEVSRRHVADGLAEYLKMALLAGWLEEFEEGDQRKLVPSVDLSSFRKDGPPNLEALRQIVVQSIEFKGGIVSLDEREEIDERIKLNLGHTVAHVIEAASEHAVSHGEAVAAGVIATAKASSMLGLALPSLASALERLFHDSGLATQPSVVLDRARFVRLMLDKKRIDSEIRLVLPVRSGMVEIVRMSVSKAGNLMADALGL